MSNILVTGAARGIGNGIVEKLLSEGFNVTFCSLTAEDQLVDHCKALEEKYPAGKVHYVRCDITNEEQRRNFLARAIEKFGPVTALVNNAGIAPRERKDVLEISEESFEQLMNVNLQATYFLTQMVARHMSENPQPNQCIINISSCSAGIASISRGEYCISKAGVSMATKLWAVRLAEFGINVYEIRPGVIKSDMTAVVTEKYDKLIADGLTLTRRWGMPEDVAKVVASFVRGDFPYSTGQVIDVDGGMSIKRL